MSNVNTCDKQTSSNIGVLLIVSILKCYLRNSENLLRRVSDFGFRAATREKSILACCRIFWNTSTMLCSVTEDTSAWTHSQSRHVGSSATVLHTHMFVVQVCLVGDHHDWDIFLMLNLKSPSTS